jgi:DNA-binding NtrC family response regulator
MILARDGLIGVDELKFQAGATGSTADEAAAPLHRPTSPDAPTDLRSLDQVEAEHVQRILEHTGGHKGRSCEILGISRPALDRKIQKYGLTVPGR